MEDAFYQPEFLTGDTRKMTSSTLLRQRLRNKRRNLDCDEQQRCAGLLANHLSNHPLVRNSQRIAAYLPVNGEMDPTPLLHHLFSLGKRIYLPVLTNFSASKLEFSAYKPGDTLVYNRLGILEPEFTSRHAIKPFALDLVIAPLVAFDAQGHRMGMGGGFYDRTFCFLKHRRYWRKPNLLGIGYEFQRVNSITSNAWDVPLHFVATEKTIYTFNDN